MGCRVTPGNDALKLQMADTPLTPIEIGLTAAIVTVEDEEPAILVAGEAGARHRERGRRAGLPFGPFDPLAHRTFEIGLRALVEAQTGPDRRLCRAALHLRRPRPSCAARRHRAAHGLGRLSRAHAHVRQRRCACPAPASSRGTASFPGRTGARRGRRSSTRPSCRCSTSGPATAGPEATHALGRRERLRFTFGTGGSPWDEERVLDRYELLYEAGLIEEARRDGREAALARKHAAGAGRADALRPSPHPCDRDRAAARQAQIPPRGVRADAARIHAHRIAAHGRGDLRAGACTSRISAAWWRPRHWSSRPARCRPRPADGRRRCFVSAAMCWRNVRRRDCGSAAAARA